MKKIFFIIVSLFLVVNFSISMSFAQNPKYKVKLSTQNAPTNHISLAYDKFAALAEKKSNGAIKIVPFHGGQLGSGKEAYEAAKEGFIEMAADSYANIVTLTSAFEPFGLPYIFESRQQALKIFKSEKIRARVDKMLEKIGLKWICTFEYGPRQMGTTKKKISWPDDLKGLKLRASRSPLEIASHNAFGAASVTIDWVEVTDALRMGTVDGLTVDWAGYYYSKLYETVRYIGELSFQLLANVNVCSKAWWDKLPDDAKNIILESAKEAEKWHEDMLIDSNNENIVAMRKDGVEIFGYTPEQRKAFKEKAEKLWGQYESTCPRDYVDMIIKEAGPAGSEGWGFVY